MSQSPDAQAASSLEDLQDLQTHDEELTHEEFIEMYLRHNPTPTDEQVHQLAQLVGIPYPQFEEIVYKMFGDIVGDAEDEADSSDVEDVAEELEGDDEDIDSLGMFLISYFLRNPDPTDVQIHQLALLVGIEPEQLEEKIYSLMAELVDEEDEPEDDETAATSANDPPQIIPNSDGQSSPVGEY